MKTEEKLKAIELRKKGQSINDITGALNVSKSSVSLWVRNIELTKAQKQELLKKGLRREVVEKRRKTVLEKENKKRQIIIDDAKKEISFISKKDLKNIGIALYWGEGGKSNRSLVRFSNSDPQMIMVMMRFFKEVCIVPREKFRGHIHTHSHLNKDQAELYWSNISGISLKQFHKTYCKPSKASKNKKNSLPFGTLEIVICSTELFLKIKGWIEGLCQNIINMPR